MLDYILRVFCPDAKRIREILSSPAKRKGKIEIEEKGVTLFLDFDEGKGEISFPKRGRKVLTFLPLMLWGGRFVPVLPE